MAGPSTPGGISAAAQQAAMLGPAQVSGGTVGQGFAVTPSAVGQGGATAHRGVATVSKEKASGARTSTLAAGLKVQRVVFEAHDATKAAASWESLIADQIELKVFAVMMDGKNVRFVWGVGKIFDVANEMDINTTDLTAFLGDRDKHGNSPSMVALPPQNSVNWVKVTAKFEETEFEAYYDVESNNGTLITIDSGTGAMTHMLPRLLYLPGELGHFVAQQPRTPVELLKEAKRLAADPNHPVTEADIKLVKKWCIAAGTKEASKSHSILRLNTTAIMSDAEAFVDYKQNKCNAILGPAVSQASQLAADQARVSAMASSMVAAMVPNMLPLAGNPNGGGSTQNNGSLDASGLTKGRELETAEKFQLCGWSGVSNFAELSPLWRKLLGTSNLITRRSLITKALASFEKRTGYAVNQTIFIPEHFFKDVLSLKVDCDEAVATTTNLDRGFSAQMGLKVSLEYIADQQEKETARRESQHQRTYNESMIINKTASRPPPVTIEQLKLGLATYGGLLDGFYTEHCPLLQDVLGLRAALDMPQVVQKEPSYDATVCSTHWYNVLNQSRAFFYQKADEDDFNGKEPRYASSLLAHALQPLIAAKPIEDVTFPKKWKNLAASANVPPPEQDPFSRGTSRTGMEWGGPNIRAQAETTDDISSRLGSMQLNHCHPIVLKEFKEYHKTFGGLVHFNKLCDASNTSPEDLPYLTAYGGGKNNKLCYSYILGKCLNRACQRAHVEKVDLLDPFLCALCDATKSGREWLIRNEKPQKRSGGKRKFDRRN